MENKYRFWQLLEDLDKFSKENTDKFNKIEIPILQRDYAQGRDTPDVKKIRRKFTSKLIKALCTPSPIELDFVYGSVEGEEKGDKVFVPLDGQQRLTTLFLLHWYLAAKEADAEGMPIDDAIKSKLKKFSYETRPSACDFCKALIEKCQYANELKIFIRDAVWYNDEWDNDPTVIGMITMLDTFQKSEQLNQHYDFSLFERLINEDVITFYFITLKKYGLTEDLYIRMNARGKILNDFENFKSEFYKIINYNTELLESFKSKIEYTWVSELWDFKGEEVYIVDTPFMNYLRFITEMLYFKQSKANAENYETDFSDFEVLKNVYSNKENLKFLIFSLDNISFFRTITKEMFWKKEENSHSKIIEQIIYGNSIDINSYIIFYATLRYFYNGTTILDENYFDFIRVVRNLIYNTKDKLRRVWANILGSIEQLIISVKNNNVYNFLSAQAGKEILVGFHVPQRDEEVLKAKLMIQLPASKSLIFKAEENEWLTGNIKCLLKATFTQQNSAIIKSENINANLFDEKYLEKLDCLLNKYQEISKDHFDHIWGSLLITPIYYKTEDRVMYISEYAKHNAMVQFMLNNYYSKMPLHDYLISIEKKFIQDMHTKYDGQLIEINDYKERLFVYYILTRRIMNLPIQSFFRNGYHFGWLEKGKGFKSMFDKEEEGPNPIFQTYGSQFRYNLGLNAHNALPPEIVGNNRPQNPFDKLINWAK